jgi:lysophospholipase L1-like esterase
MLVVAGCLMVSLASAQESPSVRWKAELDRFDKEDAQHSPAEGGIVFVGSSSIRLWNLPNSFPGMPVINRGFGGSEARDAVALAERIVIKYRPRVVVFYSGDNDIARGQSPTEVAEHYRQFVLLIREKLPEAKIILLSIKPSEARKAFRAEQTVANFEIEKIAKSNSNVRYVDVGRCLLDDQGVPRRECFILDRLHLSDEGYRRWSEELKPILTECLNTR